MWKEWMRAIWPGGCLFLFYYNKQKYLQYKISFIVAPNSGIQKSDNIKY